MELNRGAGTLLEIQPSSEEMAAILGIELFLKFGMKCFIARYGPCDAL